MVRAPSAQAAFAFLADPPPPPPTPGKYQIAYDVDITRDLEPPDDNLYVRVNVLKDVGQFVGPESGSNVDLKKGDEIFLRRGDIEHLVRQGDVEHVVSA